MSTKPTTTARQLPGLYWDCDKQRYFPLAYRQTDQPKPVQRPTPTLLVRKSVRPLADLRSVLRTAHKDALIHQVQSTQVAYSHQLARSSVGGASVSAFQSDGDMYNFAGDTDGWFYLSHDTAWTPHFCLDSAISSICVSNTTCVAASFGPECRILYAPLDLSRIVVQRIDSDFLHDVWTADIYGSRLVLGAGLQAVMIEDIAVSTSCQRLHTRSDVLALAQRDNIIYTGLRTGGILRFDTRLPRSKGYPFLTPRLQHTNSITGLKLLRDHQLIASFIDGGASLVASQSDEAAESTNQMSAFDIRFPTGMPLMTFTGNFNQYTVKLPLVTDPSEKFLFAAGQDNRVRLWSLLMGGPPLDPGGADSAGQSVFRQPFQHRVTALQVVEERERMYLWAASGTEVSKHALGYRTGICI